MNTDFVNGMFEATAGLMVINNCLVLFKHKRVRGVSIVSTAFFTVWGLWNLYYYPHLGQFYSFIFGVLVVLSNLVWVIMMVCYVRRERENEKVLP